MDVTFKIAFDNSCTNFSGCCYLTKFALIREKIASLQHPVLRNAMIRQLFFLFFSLLFKIRRECKSSISVKEPELKVRDS